MKTLSTIQILLAMLCLGSCEFHQSAEKDLTTGAVSRGDGLGCDEIILKMNDKAEKRNTFVFGEKVNIEFKNIIGFKRQDGKAFPGLSMYIVKNEKDTVESYPNLLEDMSAGTDLAPLELRAAFRTAFPYSNQEKYKVLVKIWDMKGEGVFTYEFPFKIEENKLLKIDADRIAYSRIYLWNESLKNVVADKKISRNDELMLLLNGINGLDIKDGRTYPVLSLDVEDGKGKKIISDANLLRDYEAGGVSPDTLQAQIPVYITFGKGQINNPYVIKAVLKDKYSSKKIEMNTELELH